MYPTTRLLHTQKVYNEFNLLAVTSQQVLVDIAVISNSVFLLLVRIFVIQADKYHKTPFHGEKSYSQTST